MTRWAGRRVYEKMWKPLLIGKFGPYYQDVNMAWMWARLKARSTRLGTFEGGFQAFADMFAGRLREMGVDLRLERRRASPFVGSPVDGLDISVAGDSSARDLRPGTGHDVTGAAGAAVPGTARDVSARVCWSSKSMGAVVMVLSLKHQLSTQGYYWFNLPKEEGYPFLALVEHTNFVPPEKFGGDHIVYAGDYLEAGHEYFSLSDEQLIERFTPAFQKFNPAFSPGLDQEGLGLPHQLCTAGPTGEPLAQHPNDPDADRGSVFRLHEPGLSVGPRHQLRGRDRSASRTHHAGRSLKHAARPRPWPTMNNTLRSIGGACATDLCLPRAILYRDIDCADDYGVPLTSRTSVASTQAVSSGRPEQPPGTTARPTMQPARSPTAPRPAW